MRIVAVTCALACAFVATPAAADTGPLFDQTDLDWAMDLEERIADNIWGGQVYEVDYATPDRNLGEVTSVNHFGDSALWTGTYLASQSFRYATAKHHLATDPGDAFWQAQRDEALARVEQMVDKFHILTNISGDWNHEFELSLEQAGFGGGVFAGEPGYLMRACIPADAPEWQRWSDEELGPDEAGLPRPYHTDRRLFGPLRWTNDDDTVTEYICEDGTSRDAYAGTTFGLLTAFDLVSADVPEMRTQIRDDIVTLTSFAWKYLWTTPRPHGRISIPVGSNHAESPCTEINAVLPICGHDFENFISPLFTITPFARLNMAQAAKHVTETSPGRDDTAFWDLVYTSELATMAAGAPGSQLLDQTQPYNDYYKHNLDHLIGYNLMRNAPNGLAELVYAQTMAIMDSTTRSHLNAHFETITYAITGEQDRRDDAVAHLRQWRDYRTRIEAGGLTDNRSRCSVDVHCVSEDSLEMTVLPGTDPVFLQGSSGDVRARDPLPIADRPPTDFLWQRAPNQLNGSVSDRHQAPGIDYLLPYWMLRYHTEVMDPLGVSFPTWLGPSFR